MSNSLNTIFLHVSTIRYTYSNIIKCDTNVIIPATGSSIEVRYNIFSDQAPAPVRFTAVEAGTTNIIKIEKQEYYDYQPTQSNDQTTLVIGKWAYLCRQ